MKKNKTLLFQLGIIITVFITVIEAVLLVGSYQSHKMNLLEIRETLEKDTMDKAGKHYLDLHPNILSDADIERRMNEYTKNIILLVALIIFFVVSGTLVIYQLIGGRHIKKLTQLIQESRETKKFVYYPENEIPKNDIGQVIYNRNILLHEIEAYQNNLEHKLEEMKKELVHSAKLSTIGELSSTIAHDLKNPLSVIVGNASIIEMNLNKGVEIDDDKLLEYNKKTMFAAERLNKLVSRMNQFNRKEDAKENIDFCTVLNHALVLLESKVKKNNIKINTNLDSIKKEILGDSAAIEQVFMNLFGNAIDAMEEKGVENKEINILATQNEDEIQIKIQDNGPGIPNEIHDQVFASFFTTKEKGKGTGLGLRICSQIIEDHGGKLKLSPYKEGEGAEFVITL